LIEFYRDRGLLETIDGSEDPDSVFAVTVAIIKKRQADQSR